jgi:hypothetical protein
MTTGKAQIWIAVFGGGGLRREYRSRTTDSRGLEV